MEPPSPIDEIFRRNQKRLWAFLYRLARDVHDAEDLLQTTFLRFLEEERRGRIPRGKELAVLHRLAYQSFVDQYRRHQRRVRSGPAPGQQNGNGLAQGLSRALTRTLSDETPLTERQRSLLCLRAVGSLSPGEAMAALSLSRQTYYRDMEKAATTLRRFLKEEGFDASGEELP